MHHTPRFATSRLRYWLLSAALLLSLLIHLGFIFGDFFYSYWFSHPEDSSLRPTNKTLSQQQWQNAATAHHQDNVTPQTQRVWLLPPNPTPQATTQSSRIQPTITPHAKPKSQATPHPITPMLATNTNAQSEANPQGANASNADETGTNSASGSTGLPASSQTTTNTPAPTNIAHVNQFPQQIRIMYRSAEYPVPAYLEWQTKGDQYQLSLTVSVLHFSRSFNSEGRILDAQRGLQPLHFTDTQNGTLKNEGIFDWDKRSLNLHEGDKNTDVDIETGDQDLLSAIFQLALTGANSKQRTF